MTLSLSTAMEQPTDTASQGRRNRTSNSHSQTQTQAPNTPNTFGYHNTFHTHHQIPIGSPPSYARANEPKVLRQLQEKAHAEAQTARCTPDPPPYTCSVEMSSVLGLRAELSSPFTVASNREWHDTYVVLRGTQLCTYRIKSPGLLSKTRKSVPGRLLRTYTLQHAEVGVASDFKKSGLVPKSPFAHLVPAAARPKLYETDPHLFEPVREHVLRLRLETEQFLLCAPSQEVMLDWVESLCAAIDISAPLEDRSEPRYRSLPRRSRRQRVLDGEIETLSTLDAGRRIIAQQEQIIRALYPHLAADQTDTSNPNPEPTPIPAPAAENDEFDAEDVRLDETPSTRSSEGEVEADRKAAHRVLPTSHQTLRYRRRCAPVLLSSSPRVSDVVFSAGTRMRISVRERALVEYTFHPPRYDAHQFPRSKRPKEVVEEVEIPPVRPLSPIRGLSEESVSSIRSFGEELAPSASRSVDDVSASGPPSLGGISQVKPDGVGRLEVLGLKREVSEDGREGVLGMGVPLLV